jgi:sugar/nucleoside kinase (ribokinase family)
MSRTMKSKARFDIAFLGHYTKDTIILGEKEEVVDGGAINYGANVTARMGLRTAVITRMAREDFKALDELDRLGVRLFRCETAESTRLRLVYPTRNLDERVIYLASSAGSFTGEDLDDVEASIFHIGASVRGEVPVEIIQSLRERADKVSLDVQGFIRINPNGRLVSDGWKDRAEVLGQVDVVKTDLVEATLLTGKHDRREAAEALMALGPEEIVLTHNDGVLVHTKGRVYEKPFVPKELRGRSGRGDTCIAAYLGKRLTAPPAEATIWAAAVTSLKLEVEGPFRRDISEVRELIETEYVN